jgi:hypothetical protein
MISYSDGQKISLSTYAPYLDPTMLSVSHLSRFYFWLVYQKTYSTKPNARISHSWRNWALVSAMRHKNGLILNATAMPVDDPIIVFPKSIHYMTQHCSPPGAVGNPSASNSIPGANSDIISFGGGPNSCICN